MPKRAKIKTYCARYLMNGEIWMIDFKAYNPEDAAKRLTFIKMNADLAGEVISKTKYGYIGIFYPVYAKIFNFFRKSAGQYSTLGPNPRARKHQMEEIDRIRKEEEERGRMAKIRDAFNKGANYDA